MKFSIKDFFSIFNQIRSFFRIWSYFLKKSFMENFIFCAVVNNWKTLVVSTQSSKDLIFVLPKSKLWNFLPEAMVDFLWYREFQI